MEVHHPTIEKKNFKEYLSEFLIIFLVVTVYRKMIDNIFWLKPGSILFVPPAKAGGNAGRA